MGGTPAELGQLIRERGREYGASTGRPRRCGWFDAFATRYAAEINGFSSVALTKLDVLDALDEIKVCVGYRLDGRDLETFPAVAAELRRIEPVYETLPGWQTDVTKIRRLEDLPAGARQYLSRISELVGKPVEIISVGPDRAQTMFTGSMAL